MSLFFKLLKSKFLKETPRLESARDDEDVDPKLCKASTYVLPSMLPVRSRLETHACQHRPCLHSTELFVQNHFMNQ